MKLKAGIPLVTKNPQKFTNAVVYRVIEGVHRNVVYVLTDFGNLRKFPSEEDMFEDYVISNSYLETVDMMYEYGMEQEWLDGQFDIRDRLRLRIELLTEALGDLK